VTTRHVALVKVGITERAQRHGVAAWFVLYTPAPASRRKSNVNLAVWRLA
jgi:hypothetical protein